MSTRVGEGEVGRNVIQVIGYDGWGYIVTLQVGLGLVPVTGIPVSCGVIGTGDTGKAVSCGVIKEIGSKAVVTGVVNLKLTKATKNKNKTPKIIFFCFCK